MVGLEGVHETYFKPELCFSTQKLVKKKRVDDYQKKKLLVLY